MTQGIRCTGSSAGNQKIATLRGDFSTGQHQDARRLASALGIAVSTNVPSNRIVSLPSVCYGVKRAWGREENEVETGCQSGTDEPEKSGLIGRYVDVNRTPANQGVHGWFRKTKSHVGHDLYQQGSDGQEHSQASQVSCLQLQRSLLPLLVFLFAVGINCTGCAESREHATLRVVEEIHLLTVLDRAIWQPDVINLNNPVIGEAEIDLGDGPVQVLCSHPTASVVWKLNLTRPLKLVTAIGLQPQAWKLSGDGAGFTVEIDDGRRRRLFHRVVEPRRVVEDRAWIPVEIDLSDWSGKTVRLILATDIGPGNDPAYDWAIWKDPTLAPL